MIIKSDRPVNLVLYSSLLLLFWPMLLVADEVRVAVASNFLPTMERIAETYEGHSDDQLIISSGSTGKLYAQVWNGAPFDVFLSADAQRPQRLVQEGLAIAESRFTYAIGRLSLWSTQQSHCQEDLKSGNFKRRLAVANPKTAPYGAAAAEVIESLGLTAKLRNRLVNGENISQTFQFVSTGNAGMGFVAMSQLEAQREVLNNLTGCRWDVPTQMHSPLVQDAVLLKRAASSDAAKRFLAFLQSDETRQLIVRAGYAAID